MAKDYLSSARNDIRRKDRTVEDEAWIRSMLHQAPYGVLATTHDGQPFLNSNLFVYNEEAHAIYMHTAHVGRTSEVVRAAPEAAPVCFSVFEMGRLLPAARALEFSTEYAGVVVFGRARLIQEAARAQAVLQQLMDKYAPHLGPEVDYEPATLDDLKRTAVFAIQIEEWSGKRKAAPPDAAGAYRYDEVR